MTSGRLSSADASVPMTNPPCTAIVSHAVCPEERWNSATIADVAAVAENQSVMPRNMATETYASWRRATDRVDHQPNTYRSRRGSAPPRSVPVFGFTPTATTPVLIA